MQGMMSENYDRNIHRHYLYVKQGPAVSTFIESRDNSEFSFK